MRIVIQRVTKANVSSEGSILGSIKKGLVVFLGLSDTDTLAMIDKYIDKIIKLRIFDDQNGKTNLSLSDVDGELLVISQFTLYADCRKGNRPSFVKAGSPAHAKQLYEYFIDRCKEKLGKAEHGSFGADMQVELVNDGPFTIVLDSDSNDQ